MEAYVDVKKYILPGMKLWVSIKDTSRLFMTSVSDVYDTSFTIYPPVDNGDRLIVTKKTILEFMFILDNGKYYFTTNAIGIIKDKVTLLAVNLPAKVIRNELRAFYRVEFLRHIPVFVRNEVEDKPNNRVIQKGEMITMMCTDISGGGIKLLSPVKLNINDKLDIDLSCFIEDMGKVEGIVVRNSDIEDDAYVLGTMFSSLTDSQRDKIVKRVFMRQTEQKKLKG